MQTHAVALTAVEQFTAAAGSASRIAAASPQANASGPSVDNLARAALLIALAPVWYAAFPITLPATVALVYFAAVAISCISACGVGVDPLATLEFGVSAWAMAPIDLVQDAIKNLVPQPASAAAARTKLAPSRSRVATSSLRRAHRGGPGTANVNAKRASSTHRAAKNAPTPGSNETTATAGSGRGTGKKS
ncbi:hypothetical protein [Mycolicibacterium sp. P1-5]|uniref:hypothetical protein n=1 Tax=Mycolicibacterium sp. P1-5 TaxID=2024617 RepID=UPI0011EE2D77|nr:hypothetical protein [Mycolicibacterium sp. P1-5]KAA0110568.1 hypothetical protein CIW47_05975 [Mycolicibacterium sp. P1-5]